MRTDKHEHFIISERIEQFKRMENFPPANGIIEAMETIQKDGYIVFQSHNLYSSDPIEICQHFDKVKGCQCYMYAPLDKQKDRLARIDSKIRDTSRDIEWLHSEMKRKEDALIFLKLERLEQDESINNLEKEGED